MEALIIVAVVVIMIISSAKKNQQQAQRKRAQQLTQQQQVNRYIDGQQGVASAPSGQKLDYAQQQALKERLQAAQRQRQAAQRPAPAAPAAPMRPNMPQPMQTMTHRMVNQPFAPVHNAVTDAARIAEERHYQGAGSLDEGDCAPEAHLPQSTEGVGIPSQMGPANPQGRPARPSDRSRVIQPVASAPVYDAARLREAIVAMEVFGAPRSRKKWQSR